MVRTMTGVRNITYILSIIMSMTILSTGFKISAKACTPDEYPDQQPTLNAYDEACKLPGAQIVESPHPVSMGSVSFRNHLPPYAHAVSRQQ
jgi:hypothetical protein